MSYMSEDQQRSHRETGRGFNSSYLRNRMAQNLQDRIPKGHRFEFPPDPKQLLKEKIKSKLGSTLQELKGTPKNLTNRYKQLSVSAKKRSLAGAVVLLLVVMLVAVFRNDSDPDTSAVLSGSSTANQETTQELPREKPRFKILYPSGKKSGDTDVVKISPEGRAAAYTIIDTIDNIRVQITQQQLPEAFKTAPEAELDKAAKNFQATSVIQIDEDKIYHGYSERTRVQSLLFIKEELLIFIASNTKMSDDFWVGYIKGLQ